MKNVQVLMLGEQARDYTLRLFAKISEVGEVLPLSQWIVLLISEKSKKRTFEQCLTAIASAQNAGILKKVNVPGEVIYYALVEEAKL